MSIYMIDIPTCPMVMEAPDICTAKSRCGDLGIDPVFVRRPTPEELEKHKGIWRDMQDAIHTESKRQGREL